MAFAVKEILAMMDLTKPISHLSKLGCMASLSVLMRIRNRACAWRSL